MKRADLCQVFLWNGRPVEVVSINTGLRSIHFRDLISQEECPHCAGPLPPADHHVIEQSPLFQRLAEPIPTLEES